MVKNLYSSRGLAPTSSLTLAVSLRREPKIEWTKGNKPPSNSSRSRLCHPDGEEREIGGRNLHCLCPSVHVLYGEDFVSMNVDPIVLFTSSVKKELWNPPGAAVLS